MNRRLVGCGCVALLLHVALASLAAVQPLAPQRSAPAGAEADIELVAAPLPPEEPRPAEPLALPRPVPPPAVLAPALTAVAARVTPKPAATALAGIITSSNAPAAAGAVPEPPPEESAEPPTPPARRLSLADLGLTGTSAAILPPLPDAPPASAARQDVAGMKAALAAHDVALGLGPGGAVADQLRRLAHDVAPLGSQATISVDLARDGSLEALWLEDVTSNEQDWRKVLHTVRLRIGSRSIASGGPVRVTLLVTSRSAKRSGSSGGPIDFDVSNIGSPTLHTLHVRVLGQSPL